MMPKLPGHVKPISDKLLTRLKSIDWFARCGEPQDFKLTVAVQPAKTWSQVGKALKSTEWGFAKLEARNQLTLTLSQHHREKFQNWNDITEQLKRKIVATLSRKVWEPFRERNELDVKFVHSVEWTILAALMEDAYRECEHGCFFFHELFAVYEAGHLPCGWDGEWPQGQLIAH